MMKVTLIRHTSPDVPKGTCYGHTDVALKETFEQEAAITAQNLKGMNFDKVYSSPYLKLLTEHLVLWSYVIHDDVLLVVVSIPPLVALHV